MSAARQRTPTAGPTARRPLYGWLLADALSVTGTRISMIAIPLFVLDVTGSATRTGLAALAEMLPLVIFKVLGGPVIDRVGARRVAITCDVGSIAAVGAIPLLYDAGLLSFSGFLALVAVAGALRGPGDGAKHSLVPALVAEADVPMERATGLSGTVERTASMLGAGLGGLLIAAVGPADALLIDAASFGLSALVLAWATVGFGPHAVDEAVGAGGGSDDAGDPAPYLRQLGEGWRFLRGDRVLLGITVMVAMTNLLDAAWASVLMPVWSLEPGRGAAALGLLFGLFSGFSALGALCAATWGERLPRYRIYLGAFLLAGLPRFLVLALDTPLAGVLAVFAVGGFACGFINPILGAVIFERIPSPLVGRVSSLSTAMCWSLMPLGGLLGGLLVDTADLQVAMIATGIAYFAVTMLPALDPRWRELDRRPGPRPERRPTRSRISSVRMRACPSRRLRQRGEIPWWRPPGVAVTSHFLQGGRGVRHAVSPPRHGWRTRGSHHPGIRHDDVAAIAAAAVALLLFLIIRVRLHAFVALVLVSAATAVAAGIPVADVPTALMSGFSSTLGSVALLVGFGVMLGRLLEVTGGAQVLADTLIGRFGEKRAPLALGVAALLFGFPIFFDAGLVVFLPIIITVARRFGGSVILYAFPAAGAFAGMHALVPPHPGPVAAAGFFDGDIGVILLIDLPVAIVAWYVGVYLVSQVLGRRIHVDVPELLFGPASGGNGPEPTAGGERTGEAGDGSDGSAAEPGGSRTAVADKPDSSPLVDAAPSAPSFGLVLGLLLLPMLLIAGNTVITTLASNGTVDDDATWVTTLQLLGNTPIALLITLLVAIGFLGTRGGRSLEQTTKLLDESLAPICSIILITGAGGMFGGVLGISGIGESLTSSLSDVGLPILVQAFLIATLLRVAQGSATVSLTTTSGLLSAQVLAGDYSSVQVAALVIAIAAGATVLSHVNDSGFWLISRFFEMDEITTLKTWTVMETTLGLSAFVLSILVWSIG